jgi:hypothetical protein
MGQLFNLTFFTLHFFVLSPEVVGGEAERGAVLDNGAAARVACTPLAQLAHKIMSALKSRYSLCRAAARDACACATHASTHAHSWRVSAARDACETHACSMLALLQYACNACVS